MLQPEAPFLDYKSQITGNVSALLMKKIQLAELPPALVREKREIFSSKTQPQEFIDIKRPFFYISNDLDTVHYIKIPMRKSAKKKSCLLYLFDTEWPEQVVFEKNDPAFRWSHLTAS